MIDTCIEAGYDADEPEFWTQKKVRAKKTYQCCECGNNIDPGKVYERISGKWDGEIEVHKTCLVCAAVRDDFCSTFMFGTLWEVMWETYGLGYDTIDENEDRDWSDAEWAAWVKKREEQTLKEKRWREDRKQIINELEAIQKEKST